MTCALAICLAVAAISVTDGDTLRAGELRLRLWGIDAPEMDTAAGPASRRVLQAILARSEGLACDDRGPDRFGRTVARCDLVGGPLSGIDLACALVQAGAARDWPRYSGRAYARCAALS